MSDTFLDVVAEQVIMSYNETKWEERRRRSVDSSIGRRSVLQAGVLSTIGLGLADWVAAGGDHDPAGAARHCILIWLDGGPSHLETWDPKPEAPVEVRGPFSAISTRVPGVALSEHLPETAKRLDRIAIVRSVTSPLGEHNFGTHYMMTGYRPTPVLEYACHGSIIAHVRAQRGVLPSFIAVPDFRVGGSDFSGAGYLPASARPFALHADPARPDFSVRDLDPYPGVDLQRLQRRRQFLQAMDRASLGDAPANADLGDPAFEQAFRLMASPEARQAFDLTREPRRVRDRYGRRTIGQACLLARRLIERGVAFVTVNHRGWDTHTELVTRLRDGFTGARTPVGLVPSLDRALSALLDDLGASGLLDETLIVVMGEFGRTPKMNVRGGRDHWPRVFSVAMGGAGIPGGTVIGSSDATGEVPKERPVTPADVTATLLSLLGVDRHAELQTEDGRPVRLHPPGSQPISELVG